MPVQGERQAKGRRLSSVFILRRGVPRGKDGSGAFTAKANDFRRCVMLDVYPQGNYKRKESLSLNRGDPHWDATAIVR